MSDPYVNKWKQTGRVYLWKYLENIKNYPGWHMTADDNGGESLLELLDRMENANWSSTKMIKISPPDHKILKVPNNKSGYARWKSPRNLKLKYPKDKVCKQHWHLEESGSEVLLILGLENLRKLRKGIENLIRGYGDYSICLSEASDKKGDINNICLWFWWILK